MLAVAPCRIYRKLHGANRPVNLIASAEMRSAAGMGLLGHDLTGALAAPAAGASSPLLPKPAAPAFDPLGGQQQQQQQRDGSNGAAPSKGVELETRSSRSNAADASAFSLPQRQQQLQRGRKQQAPAENSADLMEEEADESSGPPLPPPSPPGVVPQARRSARRRRGRRGWGEAAGSGWRPGSEDEEDEGAVISAPFRISSSFDQCLTDPVVVDPPYCLNMLVQRLSRRSPLPPATCTLVKLVQLAAIVSYTHARGRKLPPLGPP